MRSRGERRIRRFSHLSAADARLLECLDPAAAREFERELRAQAKSDERHAEMHAATGASQSLERIEATRSARWNHGTGGGRVTPRMPASD